MARIIQVCCLFKLNDYSIILLLQTKSKPGPSSQNSRPGPSGQKKSSTATPSSKRKSALRKQKNPKRSSHALREIRYFQKTTHLVIPRLPFSRLVRDLCMRMYPHSETLRWQRAAIECLQEAAEAFMVMFLSDANLLANHAGRVTIMPKDMRLIHVLKDIRHA